MSDARGPVRAIAALLWCALAPIGCSGTAGHTHAYHLAQPFVEQGRSLSLALAVWDRRPSVAAGGRPDFVGAFHPGPRDITTASSQPLAADFAVCIRRGLQAAGYRVTPVRAMERSRPETVTRALVQAGGERLMSVQIDEWRYDAHMRGQVAYDVTLRVFDPRGEPLGQAVVRGHVVLGAGAPPSAPALALEKLEQLLNDPAIKAALASAPRPVREPPPESPAVVPGPPS